MSKSARTRERLQSTAVALFQRDGYDATTVQQIADAAGVSQMTFFRYFPTKERVLLDDPFDPEMARLVVAAPRDLPPLARICAGLRTAISALDLPAQDEIRARVRIGAAVPALTAAMWANTLTTQRVIADALVDDGTPPTEAAIAAAAVLAALTTALQHWALDATTTTLGEVLGAALDLLDAGGTP